MKTINYWFNRLLEWIVISCVAATIMVVLWGVMSRFVVAVPSRWTEELAIILLTWTALLGAAIAFKNRQHLGVDYLFNKLDKDARRLNAVIVQLLVILFALCVMIWGGSNLVLKTLATGQVTAALGVPVGYTYAAVPLSGLAIVLFAIEEIAQLIAGQNDRSSASLPAEPPQQS
jgi:TRAP-type C4-dicarboxylate transport system permease small subunit